MTNLLRAVDISGSNFSFLINKEEYSKSWQGGLLTLIFILPSLLYVAFQLNYWLTYSYSTKVSQTNYINNNIVNIDKLNDFMLAFCPGSASNSTYKDPLVIESLNMTLEWHYITRNPWQLEDKQMINLTLCTDDMFPDFLAETYDVRMFRGCTCAKKADMDVYNITYFFTDTYTSYLQYTTKFNDEINNNDTLYQKYYDYYRANTPRLFTYFVDSQGNIDDFEQPFNNYINYHYSYLNPGKSIQSDLFFNKLIVKSDDSFIGSSKNIILNIRC